MSNAIAPAGLVEDALVADCGGFASWRRER